MTIDAYLQIEGVKGESNDSDHQGWIECESVNWGVSQPKSATTSTAGGHTAGRADLTDVTFTKQADLSSPLLLQMCAGGKTISKAKFEFQRADGGNGPVKYYEMELENVLISHVSPSVCGGGIMTESVGLKFSKVRWKYTRQKIAGGASGNTTGGWDLATNRYA